MPLILPKHLLGDRKVEAIAEATHLVYARASAEELRSFGVNVYRCPICHKRFRSDHEMEPLCTGPSESRDDHPPAVMVLQRVDTRW